MSGFSSPRDQRDYHKIPKDVHITDRMNEEGVTEEIHFPRRAIELLVDSVRAHNTDVLLQLFVDEPPGEFQVALRSSYLRLAIKAGFTDLEIIEAFESVETAFSAEDRAIADGLVQIVTNRIVTTD